MEARREEEQLLEVIDQDTSLGNQPASDGDLFGVNATTNI